MKACHSIVPVFDDPNLVSAAGLVPVLELAARAGLDGLLAEHLSVPSPNAVDKSRSVIAGMLAGADSIDDLDLLRSGGMARVVEGVRAPSTLGTYLRTFTHGHVQQIDKINACVLAGLAGQVLGLLGGGRSPDGIVFIDVDDTIRAVHGYAKQAAGFGYTRVRGLNVQLATASTPTCAPVVVRARLRRGNVASHTGSARLLAQAVTTTRSAGGSGQVMARADSAYYLRAFLAAAVRHDAWFSVTARMNPQVVKAIASIDEDAWTPISYPNAVWDEQVGGWVSDAQVAEVPFTAFTSLPKAQQIICRLVVRRVRRQQPRTSDGSVQGELFADWRHHAFVTNSTLPTLQADQAHRGHAVEELVVVADAGMLSASNLAAVEDAGFGFIVGSRTSSAPHDLTPHLERHGNAFEDGQVIETVRTMGSGAKARQRRVVWHYSFKRDNITLNKQIERAEKIADGSRPALRDRFVTIDGKTVGVNWAQIEKARTWQGLKGYVTNIPPETLDGAGIVAAYHDLFQVEASFRMAKSDLKARPMFHAQEDSIQAHLTIVFCALAISRHLQKATGISIRRIVRALKPLRDVTVQISGKQLVATTPPAGEAAEILAVFQR